MTTATVLPQAPAPVEPPGVPEIVRRRLSTPAGSRTSWLVTAVIVSIAAILRFAGLSSPKGHVFDEVYYPTDAWDMLQHGVEWDEKVNGPAYVVHPPLGKWLIAFGEQIFGNNELGWRFSTAIAGTLMILILIRVAYRLFHSIVLAGAAGLLMTLDGFQLVLSRTSLLDIFLGLFILMTFAAMLLDRDHYRRSQLRALEQGSPGHTRGVPWWLLVSGVTFGLACGVKWSALFFLPFFAALILTWRFQARRSAGVSGSPIADLGWGVVSFTLTTVFYLATWAGWFLTDTGYFRHYRAANGMSEPPVLGALLNLMHYHSEAYNFHSGLTKPHDYQSWPWQWLLIGRPVNFWFPNRGDCRTPECASQILLLGTPLLWWSFLPALAALLWFAIARRDWRAHTLLTGAAAGLLPWFYFAVADGRTMFSFYALPALPFLILAVVYVLGTIVTPPSHRRAGAVIAGVYVGAVALCFAYFLPLFLGWQIPYESWLDRMWLGSRWI
ncbi:phospholipid carrier-dependent glycosyltransferase [Actinoplanes sp. NPDC051861]|uniref:dolichyl-phosphate-mannose--protein mannosyltransferase n=1 Tax=Actinoplanes sp. NPDC051861 TaxID=3155170 RepID=UPI003424F448